LVTHSLKREKLRVLRLDKDDKGIKEGEGRLPGRIGLDEPKLRVPLYYPHPHCPVLQQEVEGNPEGKVSVRLLLPFLV